MRIAIVTETWRPSTDGVVTRLSATVRELVRRGHEVLILAPAGGEAEFDGATVHGVPTLSVPFVYGGKPWGLPVPQVGRVLRAFRPDVIHVVNPILLGIAATVSAVRQRVPLVASYHTNVAAYAGYYHVGWLRPVIWRLLRALHRRAAVNLATSAATCGELEQQGIPQVQLWRRGVDLDLFHPHRRTRPSGARAESERAVALYVGRVAEEKGLYRLSSFSHADGIDVVIVGDGPQRQELAERLPAATFTGILHGHNLARVYANADVFVFPSTTETLGLVLLEALASGLPVVAADSPASREILGDCAAARLFPTDQPHLIIDMVRELLTSASRRELTMAARQAAEGWGWSAATQQLLDYYRTAISSRGATPDTAETTPAHTGTHDESRDLAA